MEEKEIKKLIADCFKEATPELVKAVAAELKSAGNADDKGDETPKETPPPDKADSDAEDKVKEPTPPPADGDDEGSEAAGDGKETVVVEKSAWEKTQKTLKEHGRLLDKVVEFTAARSQVLPSDSGDAEAAKKGADDRPLPGPKRDAFGRALM